jgi:hypothetical protein
MKSARAFSTLCFVILLALTSNEALATCRAGAAAAAGGQAGYNAAKALSDQLTQSQVTSQSLLQQCISGITGTVTGPTFPSMQTIFNNLVQQVCYAANGKVNQAVGQVNGQIGAIYGQAGQAISNTGAGNVLGSGVMPSTGNASLGNSGASTQTNWWSDIWK